MLKTFLLTVLTCLTIASGTRAQEYEWSITYPPADSGKYAYFFNAVDCYGEVCTAVGDKRNPAITTNDRNVLMCFRSTDGGETWKEQDPGLPHERSDLFGSPQSTPQLNFVQQIDSLNAVAVGDSGIVIKTTDGGNTWQRQNLNSIGQVFSVNFSDPMTGVIVKYWGTPSDSTNIMITHDGGATWVRSPFCPWYPAGMCHADGGESFRAITYGGESVYTTHDDWQTFDSTAWIIPLADTNHIVSWCNFRGTDTLIGYGSDHYEGNPDMFIIQSTNAGSSWSSPQVPDTLIQYAGSMSSLDRDIVFYGGWGLYKNKIAVSRDHGMTWDIESYMFNKPDTIPSWIMSLAVTQNNEGVGIFSYDGFSIDPSVLARGVPASSVVASSLPAEQAMEIFPNPATMILNAKSSSGTFTISDPLGRSYDISHTGSKLDVSSLPSGVYFVSDGVSRAKFVKE